MTVTMTTSQSRIYHQIADDMIAFMEDSDDIIIVGTVLAQLTKLRQILCCPRAVDPSLDMGGGFESIVDRMEENHHVVIFVPFRPACDCICDELRRLGFDCNILRGGITPDEQQAKVNYFRQTRSALVCTIAYAESFDLETCVTSYFLGYSHNVLENEQSEGRTQRAINTNEFVTWLYLEYIGTVDTEMLAGLNSDKDTIKKILSRPQALIDALKGVTHEHK